MVLAASLHCKRTHSMFMTNHINIVLLYLGLKLQRVMHDWSDSDCVKILKNCRNVIPERTGKVIIVDVILEPNGVGMFDLLMIAHTSGGKERTESEWTKMLEQAGFPRLKIIKIPALMLIIEAYPV